MKKSGIARTTIGELSAAGFELSMEALAVVAGSQAVSCGGDTPYPVSTGTLNSWGQSDTQTDCSSKEP